MRGGPGLALNPLTNLTATKARMEVVIRNTTIESLCMGWITMQFDANRGLNRSEYRFCVLAGGTELHYSTGTF